MGNQRTNWRTASYSNGSGQCVEVGTEASTVAVRDTKDRGGVVLAIPANAWHIFIGSLK